MFTPLSLQSDSLTQSIISAFSPMNTAARPTKECNAATSCGISVIWTLPAT